MSTLKLRPSIESYLDASPKNLDLLDNFLQIWKERGADMGPEDIIEAKRRYAAMLQEDKDTKKHIGNQLSFFMHSWVVGEYAAALEQQLIHANPKLLQSGPNQIKSLVNIKFGPYQTYFGGGTHDSGKLFLKEELQYAHEHFMWTVLMDNGYEDLANLTQPHQPGEGKVLKMLHDKGIFTEITEKEFCKPVLSCLFERDLIMLADMSCNTGIDGAAYRMNDIKVRYGKKDPNHPLVVGIRDPELGEMRVLNIEKRLKELLIPF